MRAEHLIHLRCEVSAPDVLEAFEYFRGDRRVRLASLMDHAPGQRQFQTMEQYVLYYKVKRGLSDEAFARGDEVFACLVVEGDRSKARAEAIVAWCLSRAAYYKAPGYFAFVDTLPLTSTQKIQRAELKTLATSLFGDPATADTRSMKNRQAA